MVYYEQFIRDHVREMEGYMPILPFEVLSKKLGILAENIIKLDANENPYGSVPQVAEALSSLAYPHVYPDPESRLLREKISKHYQVPFEQILAGAGADELIDLILQVVLDPGDSMLDCPPTFGMYAFDTRIKNGRVIKVPRGRDFKVNLDGITDTVQEQQPKILFLANPNNPDGSLIPEETLASILELPLLVVIDEAYMDFAPNGQTLLSGSPPWKEMPDNLIILRTFSKWAGLAGLRVGFGVFPNWLMPYLWKIKQPYNVSVAASTAAITSLDQADYLTANAIKIIAERDRLYGLLKTIPWLKPYPTQANFILCRVLGRDAAKLKKDLAERGILIRYFNKIGLKDHVRISIGRPEDSDQLIEGINSIEKGSV